MLNAKFRHSLGVVGVGATETRATARLPGTGRASSGCDHPGDRGDRGDRGAEAENNQTLTTIISRLLSLTVNIPCLLRKVGGLQTVGRVGGRGKRPGETV